MQDFAQQFTRDYGIEIRFDEAGAMQALVERSAREGSPIGELCRKLFKDYPFGLQLIASNTGEKAFALPRRAAEEPDKYLSDLVVASYRRPSQERAPPTLLDAPPAWVQQPPPAC